MCRNKAKLDNEQPHSVPVQAYRHYRSLLQLCIAVSRTKTATAFSEPRLVEHRLSFAVEVTTVSGNWKYPIPLRIIFSAYFQWLLI